MVIEYINEDNESIGNNREFIHSPEPNMLSTEDDEGFGEVVDVKEVQEDYADNESIHNDRFP